MTVTPEHITKSDIDRYVDDGFCILAIDAAFKANRLRKHHPEQAEEYASYAACFIGPGAELERTAPILCPSLAYAVLNFENTGESL